MTEEEPDLSDPFGLKSAGQAGKLAIETVRDAGAYLARVGEPVAKELSLLIRDKVREWRRRNLAKMAAKAQAMLATREKGAALQPCPRVLYRILEEASWAEDETIQEMWAGLLASSCTEDGRDDSNLVFTHILRDMTALEAQLLNHACTHIYRKDLRQRHVFDAIIEKENLPQFLRGVPADRLEREVYHLGVVGIIDGNVAPGYVQLDVIRLGADLFIRTQGERIAVQDFFADC